jgi:hypothetical protein
MTGATEQETKDCLWRAFVRDRASWILVDGHALSRNAFLRATTYAATEAGWLDIGELIEEDQYSYYKARLTDAGRTMLQDHEALER